MTNGQWEPAGTRFYDKRSGREMLLVDDVDGQPYPGWVCYRHPDGQWVTLREATAEDRVAFELARNGLEVPPVPATPRTADPTNAAPAFARLLDELDGPERGEIAEFAAKIKTATALVVHPDDLETVQGVVAVLGRPDLDLLTDSRLERGMLYAIDEVALDPYRKTTP